jgi:hypothetical protein
MTYLKFYSFNASISRGRYFNTGGKYATQQDATNPSYTELFVVKLPRGLQECLKMCFNALGIENAKRTDDNKDTHAEGR